MIKVGIIGAGNMGSNHIRLVKEMNNYFELMAIYDVDTSKIEKLGVTDFSVRSVDDLIEKSEAIIIAAPSSLHKELALKTSKAEKHLLVEKPLALSENDAKSIVEAYEYNQKVLMVGHVEI